MFKIIFGIFGFGAGFLCGYLSLDAWTCVTCSAVDEGTSTLTMIIFGIIGALIGMINGHIKDADRQLHIKFMQERNELELKRKINEWDNQLNVKINNIEGSIGTNVAPQRLYYDLNNFKNNMFIEPEMKSSIDRLFNERMNQHKTRVANTVSSKLSGEITVGNARYALSCLEFLKASNDNSTLYNNAIDKLKKVIESEKYVTHFCTYDGYGKWFVPLDDNEMKIMRSSIKEYENEIINIFNQIGRSSGNFGSIASTLPDDIICRTAKLLWFYAKEKPFNANGFKNAVDLFSKFTIRPYTKDNKVYKYMKLEAIVARLYALNQMGGENAVAQEMKDVKEWVEQSIDMGYQKSCCALASALCWLELYKAEKEILGILVKKEVQLTAEIQQRYGFLVEGGEEAKAKLYEVTSQGEFLYDSSSSEWDSRDYDMLFRKLTMKEQKLKYSLAVSKWKKTLPLVSGQKVSKEELHAEFMNLVDDYDGKIKCSKVYAKAINLSNVEEEEAELFEFTEKKNKGISILFSSEKYGRNLNISIITLFTPSDDITNDEAKKCALSISDNMYVDSFIESIRQAVDEVIKERKEIYSIKNKNDDEGDMDIYQTGQVKKEIKFVE